MAADSELRRTPLYDCHKQAGARFVPFGGWEMPVQYSGLVDEHNAVRNQAGLFDVSHMGEVIVTGEKALEFLQHVTSNDVSKLTNGKAQYSLLTNESGGVVDDIIVYKRGDNDYLLCVNAANTDKDFQWLTEHNTFGVNLDNVSQQYAQIALQGPKAVAILADTLKLPAAKFELDEFPSFTHQTFKHNFGNGEVEILIARTGYTGEDGFELFVEPNAAPVLWDQLMENGQAEGLKPAGLGARDTLRLEACYPLHGHELADDITALESGLAWVVKLDKGDFIGRDALAAEKESGSRRKLVGLEVVDAGIIRQGAVVTDAAGNEVGEVTSGTKPPTVGKAIGIALIDASSAKLGTNLLADVRGRKLAVKVIKKPFYKRGN
ncbi:MAG: glycine cleavage system aminomethyltransferase GcvT [Bdellovibrionales bacterium]|nr:glycine cleavage system aminomethyltransferase GcvT [Bdellovibrionales bacterium]